MRERLTPVSLRSSSVSPEGLELGPSTAHRGTILIALLMAITALGPVGTQILLPALPFIQAGFATTPAHTQLALSLSMLAMGVAVLAYGPWSDRTGRRQVVIAGLLLFLVGTGVCALAPDLGWLIAGRVLQAVGGAVGLVLPRAIIVDVHGPERAAGVIALVTVGMVAAPTVAPVAGGILTDTLGWRAVFVFTGVLGVGVGLLVLRHLPETHPEPSPAHIGAMLAGFRTLLRSLRFNGYALQSSFSLGIYFAFISSAPYVMVNVLGQPATAYGLWLIVVAAGYVLGNLVAARFSERVGLDRMVFWGALGSLAAGTALAALIWAGIWWPVAIFVPGALSALANGVSLPNAQAGAVNVEPSLAGTASGLTSFLQFMIGATVAQVVGALQDDTPYAMAGSMLVMSVLAFLAIGIKHLAPDGPRGRR